MAESSHLKHLTSQLLLLTSYFTHDECEGRGDSGRDERLNVRGM
jgi:hypothetical protein